MAQIERLRVFPVKGLDGVDVGATEVTEGGTLTRDREFAFFDDDGAVVNGKRTDRVHALTHRYDPASNELTVEAPGRDTRTFDLEGDRETAERWFGDFFDAELTLERDGALGFVDRRGMGPSVVSTATLEAVASWFEEMTVESARRRLRANVEVSGVPAFWEDRFVAEDGPAFRAGGVRFEGVTPCGRCVVPQRDPDTGDAIPEFRERFVEKRRATLPDWTPEAAFDHYYSVMILTRVPEADRGGRLAVGDPVDPIESD
jgi:hypothetical protein